MRLDWEAEDRHHRVIRDFLFTISAAFMKGRREAEKEKRKEGREGGRERKIIDLTKDQLVGPQRVVSENISDVHVFILRERQQEGQLVRPFVAT